MAEQFQLQSRFQPAGDQPTAIKQLVAGLKKGYPHQTLLGVTGSGKTFTVANVIAAINKPTLVIAHNKTLAAQLTQEYRDFFPHNAVHYFVSYYDFYQPEAYIATTDTYIEKDAQVNKEIDRLRHASTQALLTRRDVIIVASVSCIYGLGSPAQYREENLLLSLGAQIDRHDLIRKLVKIHYVRTTADLVPGQFRAIGNVVEVMPPAEEIIYRLELAETAVEKIQQIDAITREVKGEPADIFLFPAKHFITSEAERKRAIFTIKEELTERLAEFERQGKLLEADRLKRRTNYDLAMLREVGYCSGIENYSRHLSGRAAGEPPDTLLSYFPKNFLTVIDESHVTVPQIRGMFAGDESRKKNLIEHGFRLPSALDNRPLRFEEFSERVGPIIYASATPAVYERQNSSKIVEQIVRPTGLVDPEITIKPVTGGSRHNNRQGATLSQIQDFIVETEREIKAGRRVLGTTLTKKMAEDLAAYLKEKEVRTEYLHSEIKTLERIKILSAFRRGDFDCLIGVNLLREGLDLPEVGLVAILDADKEGFLRSETSLIQTIGRAARNVAGRVILYADKITGSMRTAIDETNRRREKQLAYNKEHKITPQTIVKKLGDITDLIASERETAVEKLLALDLQTFGPNLKKLLREKEKQMSAAVKELDFETAALLRDEIKLLGEKLSH